MKEFDEFDIDEFENDDSLDNFDKNYSYDEDDYDFDEESDEDSYEY